MELKNFIDRTIKNYLSEHFKSMPIDRDTSNYMLDWKQITINGIVFDFMQLNGVDKNKFIIETQNDGEIGSATLNCYDENFDGCYLDNIRINPKYRRIGLATKLYEYIEEIIGEKLKPSPIKQSPEIKKFWNKKTNG
jgi:ribosomal protein S18 acetylase RimI-like enzyme